jgi:hypothetical protein
LVKDKFVCVAVNCHTLRDYKDAEVDWARSTDCVPEGAVASGSVRFLTAGGKRLERGELVFSEKINWFQLSAERALKAWAALPESERRPGAVQVPANSATWLTIRPRGFSTASTWWPWAMSGARPTGRT